MGISFSTEITSCFDKYMCDIHCNKLEKIPMLPNDTWIWKIISLAITERHYFHYKTMPAYTSTSMQSDLALQ